MRGSGESSYDYNNDLILGIHRPREPLVEVTETRESVFTEKVKDLLILMQRFRASDQTLSRIIAKLSRCLTIKYSKYFPQLNGIRLRAINEKLLIAFYQDVLNREYLKPYQVFIRTAEMFMDDMCDNTSHHMFTFIDYAEPTNLEIKVSTLIAAVHRYRIKHTEIYKVEMILRNIFTYPNRCIAKFLAINAFATFLSNYSGIFSTYISNNMPDVVELCFDEMIIQCYENMNPALMADINTFVYIIPISDEMTLLSLFDLYLNIIYNTYLDEFLVETVVESTMYLFKFIKHLEDADKLSLPICLLHLIHEYDDAEPDDYVLGVRKRFSNPMELAFQSVVKTLTTATTFNQVEDWYFLYLRNSDWRNRLAILKILVIMINACDTTESRDDELTGNLRSLSDDFIDLLEDECPRILYAVCEGIQKFSKHLIGYFIFTENGKLIHRLITIINGNYDMNIKISSIKALRYLILSDEFRKVLNTTMHIQNFLIALYSNVKSRTVPRIFAYAPMLDEIIETFTEIFNRKISARSVTWFYKLIVPHLRNVITCGGIPELNTLSSKAFKCLKIAAPSSTLKKQKVNIETLKKHHKNLEKKKAAFLDLLLQSKIKK